MDLNFRKRVDHVTYGAGIAYSPPMNVTVGPYVTVYYRDPAAAPTTMSPKTLAAITGTSTK